MSNEELICEPVPKGCSRSYLDNKNVGQLKALLNNSRSCCLRNPIYSITVEYFSPTNPIVLNYWDEKQNFPCWSEHVGDVNAVSLNILSGLEEYPSRTATKIYFKAPFPINNGKKPIFQVADFCDALEGFDEKMFLVTRYLDSNLQENFKDTIVDVSQVPSFYDGYPYNYFYNESGQIAGVELVDQTKVDLNYSGWSDEQYYDGMHFFDRMIYTKVPASYAKKRRERFLEKWKALQSSRK